jgi:F-type H+-transporting ATPase subunit delta
MTPRAAARRYASALFDVVAPAQQAERAGRDLAAVSALVAGHPDLAALFGRAGVASSQKKKVLEAVLFAGEVAPEVRRLLGMLADRNRLDLIGAVSDAFSERLMRERRVVSAEVVTAHPLTDGPRAAIVAALGRATGAEVTMTERVDPGLVGGLVARVGSLVFDGSVTRQLERMRQTLRGQ